MVWKKTIMAVMKQWDYGKPERGISVDKSYFYPALTELVEHVEPLWFDEYLDDLDQLQKVVKEKADKLKPDLIFFVPQHLHEFKVETLVYLKDRYATLVWFGDDEWRFDTFSSRISPYFTHVATTDPWSISKYKDIGVSPILSAWAAQPGAYTLPPCENPGDYKYDVSFVGGVNEVREWFVKNLKKNGIHVECFGAGWSNGRVSYEEMYEIFHYTRINLNMSNSVQNDIRFVFGGTRNLVRWLRSKKRSEQIKARNFEIPLAGGFQLTNYVPHLERYLVIGSEVAVYTSIDDCAKQIEYFLANEDERLSCAQKGFMRSKNEHTFNHRMSVILEKIWQ